MSIRPVFLDGPWRGRCVDVVEFPFRVPVMRDISVLTELWMENLELAREPLFDIVTYYRYQLTFARRIINVVSVNPRFPDAEDVFDLMLTPAAQQAAQVRV